MFFFIKNSPVFKFAYSKLWCILELVNAPDTILLYPKKSYVFKDHE